LYIAFSLALEFTQARWHYINIADPIHLSLSSRNDLLYKFEIDAIMLWLTTFIIYFVIIEMGREYYLRDFLIGSD